MFSSTGEAQNRWADKGREIVKMMWQHLYRCKLTWAEQCSTRREGQRAELVCNIVCINRQLTRWNRKAIGLTMEGAVSRRRASKKHERGASAAEGDKRQECNSETREGDGGGRGKSTICWWFDFEPPYIRYHQNSKSACWFNPKKPWACSDGNSQWKLQDSQWQYWIYPFAENMRRRCGSCKAHSGWLH